MARIVVDWGTSNFRAYHFGADGEVAETHQAAAGILTVSDRAFEAALMREIGQWIEADSEIFLSGMITSRNGWLETPYVETPATLEALAAGAKEMRLAGGAVLKFLPGVAQRAPSPDVMRGEEIQVFGAVGASETATLVHPGTHCKWVRVENGAITAFRTFMTGETFALLKGDSIIGRLIPPGERPFRRDAFIAGVRQVFAEGSAGLLNDVFTARSGALLGAFAVEDIADRLSGILIGHELKSGLALGWDADAPLLFGDDALCQRYALAFETIGSKSRRGAKNATIDGFKRLSLLPAAAP